MNITDQEIEVKFCVRDLLTIERRLQRLGAQVTAPRVREVNLRFDTADGLLTREHKVLRLRQDAGAVMTFKGPQQAGADVSVRQEIEFSVSDYEAARRLLEALGYQVSIVYEKYRTTYTLEDLTIVLDEMPFGNFIEIEGPESASIQRAAALLSLDWQARTAISYLALFQHLKTARGLEAQHLTFDALSGVQPVPADLGLRYAD
jgi:adenylate cyclase class 2